MTGFPMETNEYLIAAGIGVQVEHDFTFEDGLPSRVQDVSSDKGIELHFTHYSPSAESYMESVISIDKVFELERVRYEVVENSPLPRGIDPRTFEPIKKIIYSGKEIYDYKQKQSVFNYNWAIIARVLEEAGIVKIFGFKGMDISNSQEVNESVPIVVEEGTKSRHYRVKNAVEEQLRDVFDSTKDFGGFEMMPPQLLAPEVVRAIIQDYFLDHPEDRPDSSRL